MSFTDLLIGTLFGSFLFGFFILLLVNAGGSVGEKTIRVIISYVVANAIVCAIFLIVEYFGGVA